MGCCSSSPADVEEKQSARERPNNAAIQRMLEKAQHEDAKISKLLLLGAGESGKTTILKQMLEIFGEGFNDSSRKRFANVIWRNTLASIKQLCQATENEDFLKKHPECEIKEEELVSARQRLSEIKTLDEVPTTEEHDLVKKMWESAAVQQAYLFRSEFQLNDSAKYFLDQIDVISKPEYLPSLQDVMRARIRTIGIKEHDFDVGGQIFKFVDVGGQRSERRKWMHCFDGVTAVLYVCAISAFDQVLYEDRTINRIDESLHLFESIINSKWFRRTCIILFLNKDDLFKEKIRNVSLSKWDEKYKTWSPNQPLSVGSQDPDYEYEKGKAYIDFRFKSLNKSNKRPVISHITTAINTDNIEYVFASVKDTILKLNLEELEVEPDI